MLRKAVLALCLILGICSICPSFAADNPSDGKVWRIGYLTQASPADPDFTRHWETFRQALEILGYVEGGNVIFERRFAEGRLERFPSVQCLHPRGWETPFPVISLFPGRDFGWPPFRGGSFAR